MSYRYTIQRNGTWIPFGDSQSAQVPHLVAERENVLARVWRVHHFLMRSSVWMIHSCFKWSEDL